MPNHVTNILTALGENAEEAIAHFAPGGKPDFNTVLPMPEVLRDNEPEARIVDWAQFAMGHIRLADLKGPFSDPAKAFERGDCAEARKPIAASNMLRLLTDGPFPKDFSDENFQSFIKCIHGLRQTGHAYWYDWRCENWGTKWNAYNAELRSPTVIKFETAWSMPGPVIGALSERFKTTRLELRWADEDFGNNTGTLTLQFSQELLQMHALENDTPESHQHALDVIHDGILQDDMVRGEDGRITYLED